MHWYVRCIPMPLMTRPFEILTLSNLPPAIYEAGQRHFIPTCGMGRYGVFKCSHKQTWKERSIITGQAQTCPALISLKGSFQAAQDALSTSCGREFHILHLNWSGAMSGANLEGTPSDSSAEMQAVQLSFNDHDLPVGPPRANSSGQWSRYESSSANRVIRMVRKWMLPSTRTHLNLEKSMSSVLVMAGGQCPKVGTSYWA